MANNLSDIELATKKRLLDKCQEAFLLAIELYNRPTIQYHVEDCAFFLCNAWELMLKAYLIERDGAQSIYYPKHAERTLSLEDCLRRVYTNENDPLRKNMEKAIDLRNTSTHFVVPEYETFYAPILQACVENFDEQLRRLHGIEICDRIPENHLVLSVRRTPIKEEECRARYTKNDLQKMMKTMDGILAEEDVLQNRRFACTYVTELRSTKRGDADFTFRLSKDGETPAAVIKSVVMAKDKYPYRPGKVVEEINARIERTGLVLLQGGQNTRGRTKSGKAFSMYHFGLFESIYSMKGDERYSADAAMKDEQPAYIYSQQAVDLIWNKLQENPEGIIDRLREELKKTSSS